MRPQRIFLSVPFTFRNSLISQDYMVVLPVRNEHCVSLSLGRHCCPSSALLYIQSNFPSGRTLPTNWSGTCDWHLAKGHFHGGRWQRVSQRYGSTWYNFWGAPYSQSMPLVLPILYLRVNIDYEMRKQRGQGRKPVSYLILSCALNIPVYVLTHMCTCTCICMCTCWGRPRKVDSKDFSNFEIK